MHEMALALLARFESEAQIRLHEGRHRLRIDIGRAPNDADVVELRPLFPAQELADALADGVRRSADADLPHHRGACAGKGCDPAVGELEILASQAGLLLELADDRAGEIDGPSERTSPGSGVPDGK